MRLSQLHGNEALSQQMYADAILAIGEGREHENAIELCQDEKTEMMKVGLPTMQYFVKDALYCNGKESLNSLVDALLWLYPNGFDPSEMQRKCILASTNDSVDFWNEKVQQMNNNELWHLRSKDYLCEIDDPHGILANCLNERVLNRFYANGVPKHDLYLKVDDVCIVLRCLKGSDLATNIRVKILNIEEFVLRCEVLDGSNRIVLIPRIRFKFKLDYGDSFYMMRLQFPLRLAYCMTYNKSQSQTYDQVLLDVRGEPFSHGHLYVAGSRIRIHSNIRAFVCRSQLHGNIDGVMPEVANIVYSKVLNATRNQA